jgi:zinc transport system permease protein
LNILVSIAIVVSIKLVGIVMVTALLVIPASCAKQLARNFRQMVPISIIFSVVSTLLGIFCSYQFDSPTGATIVVVAGLLFLLVTLRPLLIPRSKV